VGATIAAARAALAEGVAVNLAGGTHHASADKGSGYCVFNDVAVAARRMQGVASPAWAAAAVLVIDLDVHQGNGTAAIFADDPTVFTLSLHGERNFPFRKVPGDLDVDLPDGCGDAPICRRWTRPWTPSGPGMGPIFPGWPSIWPARTRTSTTGWGGCA
jgi:acetoin utilization deacetylase AcuC-like enzyme